MWFKRRSLNDPLGLIAGTGDFPVLFAENAKKNGQRLIVFGIEGYTKPEVARFADGAYFIALGSAGDLVKHLKNSRVKEVVLAGAVPKKEIHNPNFSLDETASSIIKSSSNRGDDHLLKAFMIFLRFRCGVRVLDSRLFMESLLAEKGVMTESAPTATEWKDLGFGFRVAREIGKMDIGQSVVVKKGMVLALEAIEGTDEAIRRGSTLGQGDAVVVKIAKPNQDLRFDLPCIGPDTIRTLIESRSRILGVEAKKTVMIKKDELLRLANENNISIVGL